MNRWTRWAALAGAVVTLAVFLLAQRQSIQVSYAESPSGPGIVEGAAGELTGATVPTVEAMTALVAKDPVVRLPGSVARWDEARVRAAIGTTGTRILVAPPGLAKADQTRVRDVKNATIRVLGTAVTGGMYAVSGNAPGDWRGPFATGDITNRLLVLIAALTDQPKPVTSDPVSRREPTAAEIAEVEAATRIDTTSAAFPGAPLRIVELPRQPYGEPMPRYGPALARLHPDTPILVVYGNWIEYDGPNAAEFTDVATASFYGQFDERLSTYAYPAANVLTAYLGRVTDIRYAGLFDRPLPYQPLDPLRVTLPALPFLFAACVLAFLVLSVLATRRPPRSRAVGVPARLATLTSLAVEMSLLEHTADPALTRGITQLGAARDALAADLPDQHVGELLDAAESELDDCARRLPFRGFRPSEYRS